MIFAIQLYKYLIMGIVALVLIALAIINKGNIE